jgi:DNA polymerase-3 subunit beta
MRFIVSSSALFNRLQTIGRVINSKNTLPILDCFLFEIQDNILTITASDSETTLITNLELVESDANARFCINAKTIQDSMKEIAEQPLSFDINPDNMEITANYQNGRFNIVGQSADEYPEMNLPQEDMNALIIPAETMLNGINRCLFATADDELRPVMNGVYFDIQADNLTFVSTDGHKLVRNRNYGIKDHQPAAFILPKKPATILKNLLPKESDDVTLKFNERNAYITMESSRLICRLIEG